LKKIFLSLIIFISLSEFSGNPFSFGVGFAADPHDSLLFDGENSTRELFDGYYPCYWKVVKLKGYAFGTVRKRHIGRICGVRDTSYTLEDDTLKEGDIISDGTIIETGPDGLISVAVFLESEPNRLGRMFMTSHEYSLMKVPLLNSLCDALKTERDIENMSKVLIIKGKVTYDSPPSEKVKIGTEGKRSSVKHKKTRYSHEVNISGSDTVDVIRVYEGSVEINHIRSDFSDQESKAAEMEQLTKDFQEGKITMEELAAKIEEFTNNSHQTVDNLKPFTVDEGNKCILSAKSYTIEPLGAGDEDVK
jgi:hypothetical protein